MTLLVCNYAPVRFLPYRLTGEFVNVGIVLHCPEIELFDFQLEMKRWGRVTTFFPKLDQQLLKASLEIMDSKLYALKHHGFKGLDAKECIDRFYELVRIREGVIHFGPTGSLATGDPKAARTELFQRFVESRLVTREHDGVTSASI